MMNNVFRKEKAELDSESIYLKYLSLGDGRTISQLSAITGKSENALYKLQSRYNWKERIEKDSKALQKSLSIMEIGEMDSTELLAVTNRAAIEKLAMYVQHAQPTSIRDAQILVSIHQLIKTDREQTQPEPEQYDRVSIGPLLDLIERVLTPEQLESLHS